MPGHEPRRPGDLGLRRRSPSSTCSGRLAEYQRVVVLSGDVHNAASNLMSYWRGDADRPARIAQFTSSGFKNVMPVYLRALDRSAMLLQELLRARLGVERLGWTRPDADLVLLPGRAAPRRPRGGDAGQAAAQPGAAAGPRLAGRQRARRTDRTRADAPAQPGKPPDWRWQRDAAARRAARRRAAGTDPRPRRWTTPRSRPSSPTRPRRSRRCRRSRPGTSPRSTGCATPAR